MTYRSRISCGSTENHPKHDWDETGLRTDGSTWKLDHECPGWETTQWVIVTDAEGNEMGRLPVDLRSEFDGSYVSDLRATVELEARESGKPLSQTEREVLLALGSVGPDVCPYDSERCHEHLWDIKDELEGEEED